MRKRILSMLLCLCILFGAAMPAMAAQVKTDMYEGTGTADMNHGVLLYTGYNGYSGKKFTTMTDDGIDALLQTTDEVLLIPITVYNKYVDSNGVEHQIISEDIINSMTSDMINYPSYLSSVKTEYLNRASSTTQPYYVEYEHNYKAVITLPTCIEDGYTTSVKGQERHDCFCAHNRA